MADEPSAMGTKLGAYEILGFIATGGMGTVYRAKNRVTGEIRAVKVMRSDVAAEKEYVARFFREAKLAASVHHPHLVAVYEPGMDGETVFLPMELLDGETLGDRIKRDGKIPEHEAITITRDVGAAIIALHDKGILHRDLKPTNIFLAKDAHGKITPKVIDLGAAKEIEPSGEATAAGLTIGSPHYMSVEQASGARDIDARTDQFSLSVVLYQMLTGARPYENDDSGHALAKLLAGATFAKPRAVVPGISAITESAILRALSRERDNRFPTLAKFLEALPNDAPAGEDATAYAPIEEKIAVKQASIASAVTHPTATTDAKTNEKTPTISIVLFGIMLVGIGVLAWMRFVPHVSTAAAAHADATQTSNPLPPPTTTSTPLGLQNQPTTDLPTPTATATTTADAPTAAATATHKPAATPSHHSAAAPKPPATSAPCVPTPGAPCL